MDKYYNFPLSQQKQLPQKNMNMNKYNMYQNHEIGYSEYGSSQFAPVNWLMGKNVYGSYDGIKGDNDLREISKPRPMSSRIAPFPKNNNGNGQNQKYYVPQGHPLPLKHEEIYQALPTDSMFLFANYKSSPECCPSTYSTSTGCVCMQ